MKVGTTPAPKKKYKRFTVQFLSACESRYNARTYRNINNVALHFGLKKKAKNTASIHVESVDQLHNDGESIRQLPKKETG